LFFSIPGRVKNERWTCLVHATDTLLRRAAAGDIQTTSVNLCGEKLFSRSRGSSPRLPAFLFSSAAHFSNTTWRFAGAPYHSGADGLRIGTRCARFVALRLAAHSAGRLLFVQTRCSPAPTSILGASMVGLETPRTACGWRLLHGIDTISWRGMAITCLPANGLSGCSPVLASGTSARAAAACGGGRGRKSGSTRSFPSASWAQTACVCAGQNPSDALDFTLTACWRRNVANGVGGLLLLSRTVCWCLARCNEGGA